MRSHNRGPSGIYNWSTSPAHLRSHAAAKFTTEYRRSYGVASTDNAHRISHMSTITPRVQHSGLQRRQHPQHMQNWGIFFGNATSMLHTRQPTCGAKTRCERHRQSGRHRTHTSAAMRRKVNQHAHTLVHRGVDRICTNRICNLGNITPQG